MRGRIVAKRKKAVNASARSLYESVSNSYALNGTVIIMISAEGDTRRCKIELAAKTYIMFRPL